MNIDKVKQSDGIIKSLGQQFAPKSKDSTDNIIQNSGINPKGTLKSFSQIMESVRSTDISASIVNTGNKAVSANVAFKPNSSNLINSFDPRLPGDFISSFKIENPTPADKHSEAKGMARSYGESGGIVDQKRSIDRTSKLYEQSLELESYFVKIMLGSMRKTLSGKTLLEEQSFAGKMYEDMIYDERSRAVAKNAGFGLADQIYLELSQNSI